MKVGLITIHDIFNYGSIYQALATQMVIERLGYECELIDYQYPNARHHRTTKQFRKLFSKGLTIGNVFLKNFLPGRPHATYEARYESFKRENYHLSPKRYPTVESLQENPPTYDIYVSGSDQLWRPRFVSDDPSFFLGFAPKGSRKISYASSFGARKIDGPHEAVYRQYLEDFEAIAVRESFGVEIIHSMLGREVPVVLDPTLLLNHNDWLSLSAPTGIDEPYILCYGLHPNNKYMEKIAVAMGKRYHLKVVRANGKFYDYFNRDIHYVLDAGPAQCLSLFANATFVMAQSFHATAFSINFRKPFYALLRGDPDHDSRQINILSQLGLSDRIRYIDTELDFDRYPLDSIDYSRVDTILDNQRKLSIGYLTSALGPSTS